MISVAKDMPQQQRAYRYYEFVNSFVLAKMKIVGILKRAEHEDHYDRRTDFNPFTLKA